MSDAPPVELDAKITIVQAAELHRTMIERLAIGQPLIVDGGRVEEIDTAILQLLVSLWCTARERGIGCTWRAASEPLRRAARLIGVDGMLDIPDTGAPSGGAHATP